MNYEKMDWILYKQRSIVNQIRSIEESIKDGKPIRNIGIPNGISPQGLINFQIDRYQILELAKHYNNERLKLWLAEARIRNLQYGDYTTKAEIALLEGCVVND